METLGISEDISYRFSKWDPNNTEKYINNPEALESTQDIMRNILNLMKGERAYQGRKCVVIK